MSCGTAKNALSTGSRAARLPLGGLHEEGRGQASADLPPQIGVDATDGSAAHSVGTAAPAIGRGSSELQLVRRA